jgi:hypothetical protein
VPRNTLFFRPIMSRVHISSPFAIFKVVYKIDTEKVNEPPPPSVLIIVLACARQPY